MASARGTESTQVGTLPSLRRLILPSKLKVQQLSATQFALMGENAGAIAAVLLLALKHKDSILGWQAPVQQAHRGPSAQAQVTMPAPVPGRASSFCAKCGTRIIAGDSFCQGCGIPMESLQS